METQQPESGAFELTMSDEESVVLDSSDPDSAYSGDEAEGLDSSHDTAEDVRKETVEASCSSEAACTLEGGGVSGLPPANNGYSLRKRPRSETLPGDEAGWKSETEPDELPHPPPHFLPKRTPGVQPPLSDYVDNPSPSVLFKMYFDQAAVKTLCANTNKNAAKNMAAGKKFRWTELTETDVYSYLLHKDLCSRLDKRPMTHLAFREQLTAELCGVPLQPVPEGRQHFPVAIVAGASGSKKASNGRRKCRLCSKSTPFMCEACQAPLCVIVDRNCHKSFHSWAAPLHFDLEYEL